MDVRLTYNLIRVNETQVLGKISENEGRYDLGQLMYHGVLLHVSTNFYFWI